MGFLEVEKWKKNQGIIHGFGVKEKTAGEVTQKDYWGQTIKEGNESYPLVALRQVHGDAAVPFTGEGQKLEELWVLAGDALITQVPGYALCVFTADCLPIFLFDPTQKAIAIVHAGWRGTAKGIAQRVLRELVEKFNCMSEDIQAAIGPCIGPCCYEVDRPVREVFLKEGWPWDLIATPRGQGKWSLDLPRANAYLLEKDGVRRENIYRLESCTSCQEDLFYSYRRDQKTKARQINFIALKKPKKSLDKNLRFR
jgi:YfiH family protein